MTPSISQPLRYASRRLVRWSSKAAAPQVASGARYLTSAIDSPIFRLRQPQQQHESMRSQVQLRQMSSSDNNNTTAETGEMKLIYVHPLSQVVLECLQENYADWLVHRRLHHNSLTIHRDGTFEICFPRPYPQAQEQESDGITTSTTAVPESPVGGGGSEEWKGSRIWTSFDDQSKKHWLTCMHGKLLRRYMLQDNLMSAWQSNRKGSLPKKIEESVDDMVDAIEQLESSKR